MDFSCFDSFYSKLGWIHFIAELQEYQSSRFIHQCPVHIESATKNHQAEAKLPRRDIFTPSLCFQMIGGE